MTALLIIAIVLILLSLLGFTGVWAARRTAAWLSLVLGIVLLVHALIFREATSPRRARRSSAGAAAGARGGS